MLSFYIFFCVRLKIQNTLLHTESSKESEMKKSAAQNIDSINFFLLRKGQDLSIKDWPVFKVKMIHGLSLISYHRS